MEILSASVYLDSMRFAEIIKHPVKKVMFACSYHCGIMRPHKDIGVIASDHALGAYNISDFIDLPFIVNPCGKFHARRKTIT